MFITGSPLNKMNTRSTSRKKYNVENEESNDNSCAADRDLELFEELHIRKFRTKPKKERRKLMDNDEDTLNVNNELVEKFPSRDCRIKLKRLNDQWVNNNNILVDEQESEILKLNEKVNSTENKFISKPSPKTDRRTFLKTEPDVSLRHCCVIITRCDEIFKINNNSLKLSETTLKNIHNNKIEGPTPTPKYCSKCGKAFLSKKYLISHLSTHSRFKPFECPICKRAFYKKKIFIKHVKLVHFEHFTCPNVFCKKVLWNENALRQHSRMCDVNKRPFRCRKCQQSFVSQRALDRHISSFHKIKKSYYCSTCGRKFTSKDILREHVQRHLKLIMKKPTIMCHHCGCSFIRKREVLIHIKNKHIDQIAGKGKKKRIR